MLLFCFAIDICRSAVVAFEKLEFSLLASGISANCSKKEKVVWICDIREAIEYENFMFDAISLCTVLGSV